MEININKETKKDKNMQEEKIQTIRSSGESLLDELGLLSQEEDENDLMDELEKEIESTLDEK